MSCCRCTLTQIFGLFAFSPPELYHTLLPRYTWTTPRTVRSCLVWCPPKLSCAAVTWSSCKPLSRLPEKSRKHARRPSLICGGIVPPLKSLLVPKSTGQTWTEVWLQSRIIEWQCSLRVFLFVLFLTFSLPESDLNLTSFYALAARKIIPSFICREFTPGTPHHSQAECQFVLLTLLLQLPIGPWISQWCLLGFGWDEGYSSLWKWYGCRCGLLWTGNGSSVSKLDFDLSQPGVILT